MSDDQPRVTPTAVLDLDLANLPERIGGLDASSEALVLLRLDGYPLGSVRINVLDGCLTRARIACAAAEGLSGALAEQLARKALGSRRVPAPRPVRPLVTVVVCTRNRTTDLQRCLDGLVALDYPELDLLVVDNAPSDTTTADLVRRRYLDVRYAREERPGLDWARNRGWAEARGAIVAYTDDDVVVDPGWVSAIVAAFAADPLIMLVTGLVLPLELETPAQAMFETCGGFGRGYRRRWFRAAPGRPAALEFGGAGGFGTGANMAFRRELFDRVGGFDPALDVGTCTNGGGDLEMFFRVLKEGHTLVYEPAAIVRHRHRREDVQLERQITNNGVGFYAYLVRTALAYPDERLAVVRLGSWWFGYWTLKRLATRAAGGGLVPLNLILREGVGSLWGLIQYPRARWHARRITAQGAAARPPVLAPRGVPARLPEREAVRCLNLAAAIRPLDDLAGYRRVHVYAFWNAISIGRVTIDNRGASVSALQLEDAVVAALARELTTAIEAPPLAMLPADVPVSVVIATRDRPDDLRACLGSLAVQRTARPLEIVVVDNNAASGLTAAVVSDFPGVVLVSEAKAGLSYARNRGIMAATGRIVATTDDDATCPPDWVEQLVAPFADAGVMAVTGNVLPTELETRAQLVFELYGGLGRGYQRRAVDGAWFTRWRRSVPTWELGCTANAAFRASVFSDARIGLMDEALGAGTPTGCSEDTYLFYRILKSGGSIVYEPRAYVWHRHRRTMAALRQQLYSYSKGHVAYQLSTWLRDGDRRALIRLGAELPLVYATRVWQRLRRRSDYPMAFIGLELLGLLAGPWALWRSRRRVHRLRPSAFPGPALLPQVTEHAARVKAEQQPGVPPPLAAPRFPPG